MKRLVILGAGGYANTVRDAAEQIGYEIIAMLDDKLAGFELSSFAQYIPKTTDGGCDEEVEFIPAFGNNAFRLSWCDRITQAGGQLATLIHPTAYVSPRASIAPGTVILPKAVINQGTRLERGCIINFGAIIDHGCIIEEGVHVCLGAIVKGENHLLRCIKIEAGEVVERGQYPL